jgi:hypothetical protein
MVNSPYAPDPVDLSGTAEESASARSGDVNTAPWSSTAASCFARA